MATPGELGGYRDGLVTGLLIAVGLMLAATLASALDRPTATTRAR